MKIPSLLLLVLILSQAVYAQDTPSPKVYQYTWTYTYIKARENQKDDLKQFIIENWFAMDSIAVRQGLFNDYRLLENVDDSDKAEWDYIVAVEYYTRGTYDDIKEAWQPIRSAHKTVLINGLNFPQLGSVVKSENLTSPSLNQAGACDGPRFDILKPYLGQWLEYLADNNEEKLYGNLSIQLEPGSCVLQKDFSMLTSDFSYTTLGYFDAGTDTWTETFTFSNGGYSIYEWKKDGDDVLMILKKPGPKPGSLMRNRWTSVDDHSFRIITESSSDNGATWQATSTTLMKRIGQ